MPKPKRQKHIEATEKTDKDLPKKLELFMQLLITFGFKNVGDRAVIDLETNQYRGQVEVAILKMEKIGR